MKSLDLVAAGFDEQEGQKTMEQASESGQDHSQSKSGRHGEMLAISFANRCGVLGKCFPDHSMSFPCAA